MNILCPNCHKQLKKIDSTYKCENNHSFDIARQGYVNLNLHKSQNTGDNPSMVKARNDFLNNNYYQFLRDSVNELINEDDSLVDLACGEGYYTSYFKAKDKVGIDLSKSALKIASRNDKTTTYILSSIFNNPLPDKCADKIITIFAPIAKDEINRLLKDSGQFILVKPDTNHLFELKQAIYEKPYLNEIEDIDIPNLTITKELKISNKTLVKKDDLNNLFMMTPYVNTTSKKDKDKLNELNDLQITFAFIIDIYSF